LYNQCRVSEAIKLSEDLALTQDSDDPEEQVTSRQLAFWKAKNLYLIGEYKQSLSLADAEVTALLEKYPSLNKEFSSQDASSFSSLEKASLKTVEEDQPEGCTVSEVVEEAIQIQEVEVPEPLVSTYLKYRLLQARNNKAIGMNHLAN